MTASQPADTIHTHKDNRENTMTKTQEQLRQEGLRAARNMVRKYKARVAKRKADEANGVQADKPKPTGDGPSGFDYHHDTRRHC